MQIFHGNQRNPPRSATELYWRNGLLILDQNMIAPQSEKLVFVSLMMMVSKIEVNTITLYVTMYCHYC